MAHVAHFSINATDLPATRRFYEKVFGWKFNAWGPPGFYMIDMGAPPAAPLLGSLQGRRELVPGQRLVGFECTIAVDSIEDTERAVQAAGGKVIMERSIIAGVGALTWFADPDGNVFGAMQYDRAAG
jgi:predicted enzyme related to lactoylglutathione lyase